ncbi:methyltransferase 2-like [Octopus vulgaris]|uniref:Methyltransferase 2-like n=1 Tax=Octopus vulgaris TaxID=6645 RepID=A0AA36AM22_OCTVU|nr:methyltransferase 2-like [Octopus vulgaris]
MPELSLQPSTALSNFDSQFLWTGICCMAFHLDLKFFLKRGNRIVEEKAVEHSGIEADHYVLEVGFGPGIGLEAAYNKIKDGKGKVFGLDLSPYMLETASKLMSEGITNNQVELHLGSVMEMPFESNTFDRIFHCNCFYFWPDFDKCAQELYRVLKPNTFMITTVDSKKLKASEEKGFLKYGNADIEFYMDVLRKNKFENVAMETHGPESKQYQVISAFKGAKEE